MALELPTELRWRYQLCGNDVPEARHVPFIGRDLIAQMAGGVYGFALPPERDPFASMAGLAEVFIPLSGPPERGHEVSWTTGGRPGVMGGWTRHTDVCGPLRLTLVEAQELWVEHVMGGQQ